MTEEQLADDIEAVLEKGATPTEMIRLGPAFAEAMRKARRRLEKCVDLIRKGKESAALQEAQFAPPLMDVVNALSFDKSSEWAKLMEEASMPAVTGFNSAHLEIVRNLYFKKIDGNDPLYRDLAEAMRAKNFDQALVILQLIRQKNPDDANAVIQHERVEKIVQEERLQRLVTLADSDDNDKFGQAMGRFEAEPWVHPPQGPQWERALAYKAELEHRQAMIQCMACLDATKQAMEANDWKQAAEPLATARSLLDAYQLAIDDGYRETLEKASAWVQQESALEKKTLEEEALLQRQQHEAQTRLHRQQHDAQTRLNRVRSAMREVQDRELGNKRSLNEMRQDLAKLTSVERYLQDARQSLSEKELQIFNRMLEELPAEISRRQKSRSRLIMIGCVAFAAVTVLVFLGISGSMERSDQLRELRKGVDEIQKVTEMQAFLDSFSAKNPGRKEDPAFAVLLKRGRDMVEEETKRWQNLQKKVTGLQRQIEGAKKPGQLALLDEERQAVAEDSLKLNDSFGKGAEEAIDQLDLQWRMKQDQVRLGVSEQLGALLDHAQLFAERNATLSIPASQLSENLQLLNASLVSLEEKQRPFEKIDGVGLSDGQKDLLLGIRKTHDSRKATLESYDRLLASLDQATSTKMLFKFTNDLVQIGFINDPMIKAAKSVLEKKEIFATLPSSVFLPSAPSRWADLGEELSHRCLPEVLSLTETKKFLAFFSERRLKAVYSHEFLQVDLNASKKLDQKQNGSWAFANEDVKGLARKWALRGAANWSIEFERNGGAGRYRLAQTVQEITSSGISTNTYWSYWRGVDRELKKSKDSSVLVSGELLLEGKLFPNRSQLSPESSYIYPDPGKGKVNALFSSKTVVNKPLLLFLDELKQEPIDPLVKAFIHYSFMEAMKTRPNQWGLGNSPTAKMAADADYEKLFSMVQGIDLIGKWHQHLLGQSIPLRQQLESFYEESGPKSYYKESRFWGRFWQEVLLSQFSFHGYCKLDGGWSKKLPNGVFAWGISAETGDFRILAENTGEALPLTPLLVYNINSETVLRNARQSAGMSSATDPDYLRIKASLPYPFNQSTK